MEGMSVAVAGSVIDVSPSGLTIWPRVSDPVDDRFTTPADVAKEMPKGWLAFTDDVTVIVPEVGIVRCLWVQVR